MKKKVIVLGTHDPTLGRRLAEEVAKFRLSDVTESVCDNCEPVSGFYRFAGLFSADLEALNIQISKNLNRRRNEQ